MVGEHVEPGGERVGGALFARLRIVVAEEYQHRMGELELEPTPVRELFRAKGRHVVIGAFAALASYALFHIVTIFPLSWILLYSQQSIVSFLLVQILGAFIAAGAIVASGLIADRVGRARTLGGLAVGIAMFSGFAPTLMEGGTVGQNAFILIGLGIILLGLVFYRLASISKSLRSSDPLFASCLSPHFSLSSPSTSFHSSIN